MDNTRLRIGSCSELRDVACRMTRDASGHTSGCKNICFMRGVRRLGPRVFR